jgi:hypothetical protein
MNCLTKDHLMLSTSLRPPSPPIPITNGSSTSPSQGAAAHPNSQINQFQLSVQRVREEAIRRQDEIRILEGINQTISTLPPREKEKLLTASQEGLLKVLRGTVNKAIQAFSKTILSVNKAEFLHFGVPHLIREQNWIKIREEAIERIFKIILRNHGQDNQRLFLQEPTVKRLFAIVMNETDAIKQLLPTITT